MEAVMQRVELLLDQRRFAEARGIIMQGLAQDPEHPVLNAFLGYCLRMEDRAQEALQPAMQAVGRAPEWSFVHYVLALVYDGMDNRKKALESVDVAIGLEPNESSYHGLKAALLFQAKQWHDAVASAKQGLQFDPEDSQCRGILTAAMNQLGQHDAVEHLVDETLRKDPEDAFAFANKGWSCLRQGDAKEAIRHFKEALRLEPELEWARVGALEALKARNPLYRGLLAFFFKMGALPQSAQFGIMIGLFVVYRIASSISEDHPGLQPFIAPFLVAYLAFAYATWLGSSLANCVLLFHPFGRLAMTAKEKRNAWVLAGMVVAGLACLSGGAFWDVSAAFLLGILLLLSTLPLVGVQNALSRKAFRVGATMLVAILGFGIVGIVAMPQLYGVAMLLWLAYVWVIGQYVSQN